ncbi:RICIN domain-containing protein [Streptacidiphilus jiangxiensis]|uniref:Ricin-type beta-trefoil lectin domain-like n=1 Tax=Streptacidiphilus jiangxiensis TaxID=235985 RepID=A0A1H7NRY1_STRJI|nr:RICIN domain-containing protein [Streptacidiphilus jiangxiensis]SEL26121.1 Ricin-type beta-trefoil lectin domain-like [Streptacidiphilus jiangxiensis]
MKRTNIIKSLGIAATTIGVLATATAPASASVPGTPMYRANIATNVDNFCVEVSGSSTADGAKVDTAPCSTVPANNQLWTFVYEKSSADGVTFYYNVVNYHSGKCLDLYQGGTSIGTLITQNTCNANNSQLWWFANNGYKIQDLVNLHAGWSLSDPDIAGASVKLDYNGGDYYYLGNLKGLN